MYRSIDSSRIRNLKVLSRLKPGQKLNTRYHHYSIEDYSFFSYKSLLRWANGESRSQTIDSLTQLVESCVNQHGMKDDEKKRLLIQLNESKRGIENLGVTYNEDSTTCAGLEYIIEIIKRYINDNIFLLTDDERESLLIEQIEHSIENKTDNK